MDRIIILARRSQTSYLLINHLARHFDIAQVIFEVPHTRKMLRYRLRTLGWWKVANQLAFLVYDRLIIRPRSRPKIAALLAAHDTTPPVGRLPVIEVDSVNGEQVGAILVEKQPRVVVVSGTGIIAKWVLKLAPTFINIHVGITPRYRGVHGGFWAIYEGRPELAGTTIHLVDPGVDTGAILAQTAITVDPFNDTYRTLPIKQYLAALDAIAASVRAALDGSLRPFTRDDMDSRQWYSPTPLEYWRFLRQMADLRRNLPKTH